MAKTTEELAREYAENQIANVKNDTQNLLNQYEKIAQQQKNALDINRQISENKINAQRDDILQNYQTNARQAYINNMLGRKQLEQQLSQAGLNTTGVVGSAYANLENAYGNNLANLQNQRDKSINDINRQLNEAQLQYSAQENQLLANIEQAKIDLQKYGNELAYQRYQDALNNYLTFANYDNQRRSSGGSGGSSNSSNYSGNSTFSDSNNTVGNTTAQAGLRNLILAGYQAGAINDNAAEALFNRYNL